MMHGSFGTLGILTKLTFRLVPAKPYVRLVYEHHHELDDYQAAIRAPHRRAATSTSWMASSTRPTVRADPAAHFVDSAPYTNRYDWTEGLLPQHRARGRRTTSRPPTTSSATTAASPTCTPESFLGRLLLGKFTRLDASCCGWRKLCNWVLPTEQPDHHARRLRAHSRRCRSSSTWYAREFELLPALVRALPARARLRVAATRLLRGNLEDDLFLDLAIYGMKQPAGRNYHKLIEDKLLELGGVKTLISHNYYSSEEFWQIWNKRNYDAVKAITDPDNLFRDLYTKTCKAAMGLTG